MHLFTHARTESLLAATPSLGWCCFANCFQPWEDKDSACNLSLAERSFANSEAYRGQRKAKGEKQPRETLGSGGDFGELQSTCHT